VKDIEAAASVKKTINAAQWYETFAQVGLVYGPTFQGLSNISAAGDSHLTQAQVDLEPTAKTIKNESRYIFHPATLDASMQLSILAAHKSTATKFKRAYMPTAFGSVKVWPKIARQSHTSAQSYAGAKLKGVRGLEASIVLVNNKGQRMLEAANIFLTASDQAAPKLTDNPSPYTRIVWKPSFDHLTTDILEQMYPPVVLSSDAVIPSLNHLALHQLIHFKATNPLIFEKGSELPHLQRLLEWTTQKLDEAKVNAGSPASNIIEYDDDFRAQEIERLSGILEPQSSEARLMCQMYNNLPAIYSGEKTGIQVALQDNLLLDNYETGQVYREGNRRLASIVALCAHQNPALKILEVGAGTGSATNEILPALKGSSPWRQYLEYRFTDTSTSFLSSAEERFSQFSGMTFGAFDMEKSRAEQGYEQDWDIVVASNVIHATSDIKNTLINIRNTLKPGGKMILLELTQPQLSAGLVLGTFSDFWKAEHDPSFKRFDGPFLSKSLWKTVLLEADFEGLDFYLDDYVGDNVSTTVISATAAAPKVQVPRAISSSGQEGISILYRHTPPTFLEPLARHLKEASGVSVESLQVTSIEKARFRRFIFLVEATDPLFLNINPQEWASIQKAISVSTSSLWITKGDLLVGQEPLYAMISGLVRGMKTENSALRFSILDIDRIHDASDMKLFSLIQELESKVADASRVGGDSEFRFKNDILHISRLTADDALNEKSKASALSSSTAETVPLESVRSTRLQLAIEKPGVLSTLYFKPDPAFAALLPADEVEIEVRFAGVNNKDIAVLTGRHHSDSMSDECSGIITQVGSAVKDFQVGDQVYCQSFAKFGNFVRDKSAFCQRLAEGDTLEGTSTLPIAFSTALYGLEDLGRLHKRDSVLIQSATGAVGLAACQIASMVGAEIFATVGTAEKKAALLGMGFGITEDHILDSRGRFTANQLLELTGGKGIDVILCSARGEMMHEYWKCIATGGRFVEIGRTEVLDGGRLPMDVFQRNATFASFDLEVLSKNQPHETARLMERIQQLKSEGHITPLPLQKFPVSAIDHAFTSFAKGTHIGKMVVDYGYSSTQGITVRQDPFTTTFDPKAAYLLVGCLGGLGRSFSSWAVSRGARHLIYLSRTGAAKDEAKVFLNELQARGVHVSVVKGDVTSLPDVQNAVQSSKLPIKGVVHGALTLHDGLYESMSLDRFNATVLPRVVGALNLHEALKHSPLDFFEIWSSWTVIFGTATQSNYLASNSFLDAFARHRRAAGLPCTSLALSQVLGIGIVSYMPEYQQAMIRNGFYGNDENEFLQYCDAGIMAPSLGDANGQTFKYDPQTTGHLLVGIEPAGLQQVDSKYALSEMLWYRDPRFQNLIQATSFVSASGADKRNASGEEGTILDRVRMRISKLLYVPLDEVDIDKAINDYGIDSMIAAELRNWVFASFRKDISLLKLLSAVMTVKKLAEEAEAVEA
jgi:NADPH:quinone reductase-like Zn-dependent oxidoreductase/SAM-dependent methyltransferase